MHRLAALLLLLTLGAAQPAVAGGLGLSGRVVGAVHGSAAIPDEPVTQELTGSGTTNLGPTRLRGHVAGTGFIQHGHCHGTLVLTTPRGSLTLAVASGELPGFTPCPVPLRWRITRATGSLAGSEGSGTLHLTISSARFRLVFDGPGTKLPPAFASTGLDPRLAGYAVLILLGAAAVGRVRAA